METAMDDGDLRGGLEGQPGRRPSRRSNMRIVVVAFVALGALAISVIAAQAREGTTGRDAETDVREVVERHLNFVANGWGAACDDMTRAAQDELVADAAQIPARSTTRSCADVVQLLREFMPGGFVDELMTFDFDIAVDRERAAVTRRVNGTTMYLVAGDGRWLIATEKEYFDASS